MTSRYRILSLVLSFTVLSLLGTVAHAGPGLQYWQTLNRKAQFEHLKTGDKVAFVCHGCQTVSEFTITSPEQAMELCKEGATVSCPSCHAVTKVILKRQRNDPPARTVVVYVNDKGEECAFLAARTDHHEN